MRLTNFRIRCCGCCDRFHRCRNETVENRGNDTDVDMDGGLLFLVTDADTESVVVILFQN